ncbi:MAG: cyclopropane fatty acyl phospholipid synthase [Gammaproteobacteria bacterium]|nr:cyclopropane fatty acyl phospholipid synthase [Gammaproteobacteria bacterium]
MYESDYQGQTSSTISGTYIERRIRQLLEPSGIEINGPRPWDLQVYDQRFYKRVLVQGSLGLGEAYMDGWWEAEQLDEFFSRLLATRITSNHKFLSHVFTWAKAGALNLQTLARAFQVGEVHYDLGNEIYTAMLDQRMVYTCGYWRNADTLDEAQRQKLDLVCRKLGLQPGMRVLDIGCGWGSLAKYAAETYGVEVVGITVSREQVELGSKLCEGLPVEIRLQDYRAVSESFDAIVSLGMFEHVGHKNYRTFMEVVDRNLKPNGLCLLHTIGKNDSRPGSDPWVEKYVFPNGEIPSLRQISAACESLLVIEDVHNFGAYYDKTLMAWFRNFDAAWSELQAMYSRRFYRLWKYYLHSCAGAFRCRDLQLWQLVISNGIHKGGYQRPE